MARHWTCKCGTKNRADQPQCQGRVLVGRDTYAYCCQMYSPTEIETRVCARCTERKPVDDYYFVSRKLGTRRGQCKDCMSDLKAMQKDPGWKPTCCQCGDEMERFGPGRRLCAQCFDERYDREAPRENGAHRLRLKDCRACGAKRLHADHEKGTMLCAVCRSIPQGRRKRLATFNLNPRQYIAMLENQRYRCYICERKSAKTLHVDHSHSEPMIVRGLVCSTCNTMLGLSRDKPDTLRAAAAYLEAPPAQAMFPGLVAHIDANRKREPYRPVTRRRAAA